MTPAIESMGTPPIGDGMAYATCSLGLTRASASRLSPSSLQPPSNWDLGGFSFYGEPSEAAIAALGTLLLLLLLSRVWACRAASRAAGGRGGWR